MAQNQPEAQKSQTDKEKKLRDQTIPCIACKNELPAGATLCDRCDSFQVCWKNELIYGAKVIGFVVVIASAVFYILSRFDDVRKFLAWQDKLKVLSFSSATHITLANVGDGEVFVSHIDTEVRHPVKGSSSGIINVGKTIRPGETFQYIIAPPSDTHRRFFGTADSQSWERTSRRALSQKDPCLDYTVFFENDPVVLMVKQKYKDKFRAMNATAKINYYSLRTREMMNDSIQVIGIVIVNEVNEKCLPPGTEQLPVLPPGTGRSPLREPAERTEAPKP